MASFRKYRKLTETVENRALGDLLLTLSDGQKFRLSVRPEPAILATLQKKYGYWGEHPEHTRWGWQLDVDEGNTSLGYWEWVVSILEQEEMDEQ